VDLGLNVRVERGSLTNITNKINKVIIKSMYCKIENVLHVSHDAGDWNVERHPPENTHLDLRLYEGL
jgi:hypothetical protein